MIISRIIKVLPYCFLGISNVCCTDTISINAGVFKDYSQDSNNNNDLEIKSIPALRNPDRGFHVESNFLLQKAGGEYVMYNPYVKNSDGKFTETEPEDVYKKRMEQFANYDKDSLTLVQQYIYLTPWITEQLDDTAINSVKIILEALKKCGYETILRFAYSYDRDNSLVSQITLDQVRKHIEELDNRGVFSDYKGIIATLQAGFFGDWGEWAGSNDEERKGTVNALLEILPQNYTLQMRYPADKRRLGFCDNIEKSSKIGYSNDYFTAGIHVMAPGNDYVGEDYEQVKNEAELFNPYISGEIPYNEGGEWGLDELLPTMKVLQTLKEHRYSALDVSQNYELNIASWKNIPVTAEMLRSNEILFDESYFKDEDNKEVARSFYEFVRDHLGYRLNLLDESSVSVENGEINYDLTITNTGFATVVNPKDIYLVLIDSNNEIVQKIKINVNPKDWVPYNDNPLEAQHHKVQGKSSINIGSGTYKVGIWMPDANIVNTESPSEGDARFNIRFALNGKITHWWSKQNKYMVNIFSELEI